MAASDVLKFTLFLLVALQLLFSAYLLIVISFFK